MKLTNVESGVITNQRMGEGGALNTGLTDAIDDVWEQSDVEFGRSGRPAIVARGRRAAGPVGVRGARAAVRDRTVFAGGRGTGIGAVGRRGRRLHLHR
jgi:hypothetical protein